MKSSKAFWGGVLGALMMVIVMWIGRTITGTTMSIAMLLGTMLRPPGSTAWTLGLFMHLAIGGMIGLVYGWIFERLAQGGVMTGVTLGLANALVAGVVMGMMPMIHPRIPAAMSAPGYFLSNIGMLGVTTLFVMHLLYGGIVGAMYGSVAGSHDVAHQRADAGLI